MLKSCGLQNNELKEYCLMPTNHSEFQNYRKSKKCSTRDSGRAEKLGNSYRNLDAEIPPTIH